MVSFVCNYCQQTLKKPKLDQHTQRCRYASFSCIDCGVDFQGTSYRQHTQCISEAEKYEGKLYKGKKTQQKPNKPANGNGNGNGNGSGNGNGNGNSSTPKSTVEQLQTKAQELQKQQQQDEGGMSNTKDKEPKKESKKRKHSEDDASKEGLAKSSAWDEAEIPSKAMDALVHAIAHVYQSGDDGSTMAFKDLKKKCIKLVTKHPRSKLSKSDLKGKFGDAVIEALEKDKVKLSRKQ